MFRQHHFPLAFMANSLAMSVFLIGLGLAGHARLAADVAIVQGVTLALFYSFSANARNLILNQFAPIQALSLLLYRFVLLVPLVAIAFGLAHLSGVETWLAAILLMRRSVEWLDEIFLAEMERMGRKVEAVRYILLQTFLLVFALVWMLAGMPFPLLGVGLWAALPLCLSGRFYVRPENFSIRIPIETLRRLSPHIGSTAIIGITVYVFRLLLIDVAGKEIAGDLFVAFAIGGVLGSVVANAFGPSVVLAQNKSNTRALPSGLRVLMAAFLAIGLLITFSSSALQALSKTSLFWQAIGFSMLGAVPMVLAQMTRHRLLQQHEDQDLFGADVLINVLLVAVTPVVFYLLGLQALAGLYLLSSVLAWVFYTSCESYENGSLAQWQAKYPLAKPMLAGLLVFPLFFQLESGVFRDTTLLFDAHRDILKLPIPFSVIASFAILIGMGHFARARVAFVFVFAAFVLMLFTTIAGTPLDSDQQQYRFFLLAQFVLPMFALIAGQLFESAGGGKAYTLENCMLYVLIFIVPLQMISSWLQGAWLLQPSVYVFSVYQHLHYVPIMLVAVFMFIFHSLWQSVSKNALLLLIFAMAIYVVMTASLFIVTAYFVGLLLYGGYFWRWHQSQKMIIYSLLAAMVGLVYWQLAGTLLVDGLPTTQNLVAYTGMGGKAFLAFEEKMTVWGQLMQVVWHEPKTLLLGYPDLSDHGQLRVSSNYYLAFISGFGLVGTLPMLMLVRYTLLLVYKNRKFVTQRAGFLFPCMVLMFLLLIENAFYVGLRQPYSATLTFFLWGVVLNRLLCITSENQVRLK